MGSPAPICQPRPEALARRTARADEVEDLFALLVEHADPGAGSAAEIAHMAETLAVASLGDNHLWQDLQLPARAELSALIAHWFPALKAKNTHDMKWKKFLYKQLCVRAEVSVCKAPSCARSAASCTPTTGTGSRA